MKIVCEHYESHFNVGLACAATYAGLDWVFWNPEVKPTYDMFDELKPDLLIKMVDGKEMKGLASCHSEFPNTKVAIVKQNEHLFNIVERGFETRPDLDFILEHAANLIYLTEIKPNPILHSPMSYVCRQPDSTLIDSILELIQGELKIWGDPGFPVAEYVGQVSLKEEFEILASCQGVFYDNRFERHRYNAGFLKIPYKIIGKEEETQEFEANEWYNIVVSQHTYFHRLSTLLEKLDFKEEAQSVIQALEKFKNEKISSSN